MSRRNFTAPQSPQQNATPQERIGNRHRDRTAKDDTDARSPMGAHTAQRPDNTAARNRTAEVRHEKRRGRTTESEGLHTQVRGRKPRTRRLLTTNTGAIKIDAKQRRQHPRIPKPPNTPTLLHPNTPPLPSLSYSSPCPTVCAETQVSASASPCVLAMLTRLGFSLQVSLVDTMDPKTDASSPTSTSSKTGTVRHRPALVSNAAQPRTTKLPSETETTVATMEVKFS